MGNTQTSRTIPRSSGLGIDLFLSFFESTLRSLGGEFQCITIPYWDWTNTQTTQAIFTNQRTNGYWIGMGAKNGNCFGTGHPFNGFSYRGTCVSRSVMTTPNLVSPQALLSLILTTTNLFPQTHQQTELYHNQLHNWVGGDMAQIPLSPADPIFFLHHAFIDMIFATYQSCRGYANIVANSLPSNLNIYWEPNSGFSFTATMPGWSITPRNAWNLLQQFNVLYASTWLNSAFQGVGGATCPSSNRQFLDSIPNSPNTQVVKHLLGQSSRKKVKGHGKIKRTQDRSLFRPTKTYLARQELIYETFKDTLNQTQNVSAAIDKMFYKSCLLEPQLTVFEAQMFTPEFIARHNLTAACARGLCLRPCYRRLNNLS